ncbi:regulatory protein, arsR family [Brevibacterium siliguriense]|uniref:Regulatory protein, arsR family n=1 Tax=Brevibacterium siliguriense TaxID=1136497 RepID=A0A1H1UY26_9MICO|nr:metalloregulator ArsR/SmtB family transcription factor [Brevibacterium siliguriense]SDS76996.1 regulatory protein, arsR family [Brevibacterium siliguriense]
MNSDVFSAVANSTRRSILEAVRTKPRSVSELTALFELSRPAVSGHLRILRHTGLVREEHKGQRRIYHLEAAPFAELAEWLSPFERYWRDRLGDLSKTLDELEESESADDLDTD